jgi:alpha-beta hydrolase superfamily lysophospholipase
MNPQVYREDWFTGAGGIRLFRRSWRPDRTPAGVLVNLHGLGDHSGLYPTLVEHFVPRGWVVHAPDLRGNGRSAGRRGHVDAWSEYREDLHRFLDLVRREEPGLPLFLLGNSLGGLIVLEYALHYPDGMRGVIAIAPPLGSLGIPAPLLLAGRVLSRIWPGFSMSTGMDLSGLSRDPSTLETVLADPHFHRRGSARLSTEVEAAVERVQNGAPRFPLPVLVLHGASDRLVFPDGSRAFMAKVGQRDKTFREYPGGYHVLLADLDREQVLADLERWMEERLSPWSERSERKGP